MNSKERLEMPQAEILGVLRTAARIALVVGALGSVGLMLHVGLRKNSPQLLLTLFAIWVLAPFAALALVYLVSKGWSVRTRAALYRVVLVLTLASLALYGAVALRPLGPKTTFVFVIVPPVSCLLSAIVLLLAAFLSGRPSSRI
jgi:hypothetical protein